MSNDIKMTEEEFNSSINNLKGYKMSLIDFRNNFIDYNNNLNECWIGNSSEAFKMSANMLEAEYNGLISSLNDEIEQLNSFKNESIRVDSTVSQKVESCN